MKWIPVFILVLYACNQPVKKETVEERPMGLIVPKNSNTSYLINVDTFRYNGHRYIVFNGYNWNTYRIVHDPDCPKEKQK